MSNELNINKNQNLKYYLMFSFSMMIMGSIGLFRRFVPISSAKLAFLRGIFGALFLIIIVLLINIKKNKRIDVKEIFVTNKSKIFLLALTGIMIGINWMLLFESYNYTSISKATLCYYLQPSIVILLSPIVFKEKLKAHNIIAVIISIIGMIFISGVLNNSNKSNNDFIGIIYGIFASICYAIVVILNKKILNVDYFFKTIIQLLFAGIIMIPYVLLEKNSDIVVLNVNFILLLIIICLVHTSIAYLMYFTSMEKINAKSVAMLSYIDPIVAVLISIFVLNEYFDIFIIIGAVMILIASYINEK